MSTGSAGTGSRARTEAGRGHAARVRRLVEEACNKGNLAVLDEVVAPAARPTDERPAGAGDPARLRPLLAAFRAAVPDAHWTIVEQIAQGERVATRLCIQGTFSGPLLGLVPPGRPATLSGVAISRFAQGRLIELWLQADLLGFLQQLGVLPPLDLTQTVTMAQVLRAGELLADELAPRRSHRPPGTRSGSDAPPVPLDKHI
jgi:predicted ester cyclase